MKDKIEIETKNGLKIIGYTSMMAPTDDRGKGKVYKMFKLVPSDSHDQGDIHFFEKKGDRWLLLPNKSFINLEGGLIDVYQNLPRNLEIDFSQFVRIICIALYS